ncbi:MAG: protein rep [Hyphomicrobium sp.]|jgi:hypothetical protein
MDRATLRSRVARRLEAEELDDEAIKLLACGSPLDLMCSACARPHRIEQACRRRWCPVCEHQRAAQVTDLYRPLIHAMRWPLFLTLTMSHTASSGIAEDLKAIRDGWQRLRRLQWFRRRVAGGVGAIEVAMPEEHGHNGAHPHIHALLDCRWLSVSTPAPRPAAGKRELDRLHKASQAEIAAQWAMCLRAERAGIYTRRADRDTVSEVLKYSVSSAALLNSALPLEPLITALKGRKGVMPFGTIRKALKVVRAERDAAKKPLICECGCESWCLDPSASQRTNTLAGQWLEKKGAYAKFVPWPTEP